jgi:hypothetical protein
MTNHPHWTPEQLKQCTELTKLVRKAAALKHTGIENERTRRLEQQYVREAERLVETVKAQ